MKKLTIYLVRHGKTYCNEQQLYSGKSDIDLSEVGMADLNNKKKLYSDIECDYFFTSGAKRANNTLKIFFPNSRYIVFKNLFEYNFGDFELKSYSDLKNVKEYNEWISDAEGNVKCPNGESRVEFKSRIQLGFRELLKSMIKQDVSTAFGVTHGGTIGILLETMYDNSKKFYEWQPQNGEGYKLTIDVYDNDKFKIEDAIKIGGRNK